MTGHTMRALLAALLTAALAATGPGCTVSPGNTRNRNLPVTTTGTVTQRKAYGAKSHWLKLRRPDKTITDWGRVNARSYRRCQIGETRPACRGTR